MTQEEYTVALNEFVQDLQTQGLDPKEMTAKAAEFRSANKPTEEVIEEVKTDGVANPVDATVAPTTQEASKIEDTELESEDVSSESLFKEDGSGELKKSFEPSAEQEVKTDNKTLNLPQPGKTLTKNGYDYKFEINDDGFGTYYTKKKGDDQWINASDNKTEDGKIAEASIASEFGHSDFNKEEYFENQKEENKIKEATVKKDAEGIGFDLKDEAGKAWNLGMEMVESGFQRLPTYFNELKVSLAKKFLPDEVVQKIESLPPEVQTMIGNVSTVPSLNALAKASLEGYDKTQLEIKKIEDSMVKFELANISDEFSEGNYARGAARTSLAIIQSLPGLVQAAIPGVGLLSLGATSAAEASAEAQREGEEVNLNTMFYSGVVGVAEAALEKFTLKLGGKMFKSLLGQPKQIVTKSLTKYGTDFAFGTLGEGLSEVGTLTLSKMAESVVLGREDVFTDSLGEYLDTMLIGSALGGTISGTTAGSSILRQTVQRKKVKKDLGKTNYKNLFDAYKDTKNSSELINLTQNPSTEMFLDESLKSKQKSGEITNEQAIEIKDNFIQTEQAVNQIKPLGLSDANQVSVVDLLKEKNKLSQEIKTANEPSLTEDKLAKIKDIDSKLRETIVKDKADKLDTGSKVIADQLNVGVETFDTTEDTAGAIETLKNQGGKVDQKNSTDYGTIIEIPNDSGGVDTQIIINQQEALGDNIVTTSQHEVLHAVLKKTTKGNPEASKALGNALLTELRGEGVTLNDNFQKRLDQYINDPDISDADVMEEVMTLTSEGLTNGEIEINETTLQKIGKQIKKLFGFGKQPINIKFDSGKDVLNFIQDYNKSVIKGKGLSKGQATVAKEGAKGKLIDNATTEANDVVTKQSKSPQGEEASAKVQEIYESKGKDGSFEIIEQFTPIVSKIVEKRRDAPNFDRQLLTDEINTGKRGIIDLVAEYKPESGVPLAAYINKFLPARSIEASQRILGETFTEDVTEAKGVTAAETEVEVETKQTRRKIKPSSLISPEATTKIKQEIESKIKDIDSKNLTFKKLGNLAPEIIAEEIGIPVKKLTDPKSNLSKADATAIQQFVNKNADKLLKILPDGAVLEGATEGLIGTSTGVPKGLLDAFYTKQGRVKKGAGLATQKLNPGINKASFLEAFGIVDGKKQEGFSARSSQAQALKGIAGLFGRLVTNEIVRSDVDLDLKTKQDVAAGKSRSMASKKIITNELNAFIEDQSFIKNSNEFASEEKSWDPILDLALKGSGISRIDMKTKDGRERFLEFAATKKIKGKTLTEMLPKSFWRSMQGTTENLIDSIENREFVRELDKDKNVGEIYSDESNRGYKGNLPFLNVPEANAWIESVEIDGGKFAEESDMFSDMLKFENPRAAKMPLNKALNDPTFKKRQENSINGLKKVFEILETYMKDPEGIAFVGALMSSSGSSTNHFVRKSAPYKFYEKGFLTKKYTKEHTLPASIVGKYLFGQAFAGTVNKNFGLIKNNYFQGALLEGSDNKLKGTKPDGNPFDYVKRTPEGWKLTDNIWARYFNLNVAGVEGGINPSNIIMANNQSVFDKFNVTSSGLKIIPSQKASYNRVPKLNSKISTNVDPNASPQQQVYELEQLDDRAKVERSKSSKKNTFDKIFNDILESSTGIESYKDYSSARAKTVGANKGKFSFFNTPSAEDFNGLLYKTLGKGKVGDAQMAFYKTNLLDPYNRAELSVTKAKISAANDFKGLKRNLKTLPKSMSKPTGIGGFTFGQAARVAVWTKQGMNIPGLSKRDVKELNDFVDNNKEMNTFANELINIQKGKPYPKPGDSWLGGNITSDILNEINKVNRKEYLTEWQENVDIIFSEKNMNKLEAAYGPNYVEALKDQLSRMKSGSNRPIGGSRVVNNVLDWLNNSVGAVMFLNTRSAVLQTISAVNFINFGNNNIYKAGKAFANQPQFWKDFKTLMNSPYLTERRQGLKINVSESEIADAVAESSNKPKAAISYLLNKGFIMTRIADSFAIASGGSAFYRNQLDAYVKDGMDPKQAEKKAFDDFYAIAEESQQSSNPSKISQQQASGAGRVILAFANTPMQYARIIKRSSQDLINGRGDWKSNVSKIVFYGAVQNLVFNALQNALFSEAFGEEEDDEQKEDKTGRIANGMADSLLRGLGIQGAVVSALKNSLITIADENNKKSPKFVKAVYDLFDFSPPLDSKFRKLRSGANTITWEKENIKDKGFDLNNPAYLAGAQLVSGLTNLPLDRAIQKLNNIRAIMSNSSQNWQKVAMAMGWSTWDIGLPYYGVDDKIEQTPEMILKEKVITMAKETSTKEQKQMLLDLGLTKQEIKALKYEDVRVKKIIELQKKK